MHRLSVAAAVLDEVSDFAFLGNIAYANLWVL